MTSKTSGALALVTEDPALGGALKAALPAHGLEVVIYPRSLDRVEARLDLSPGTVVLVDLDVRSDAAFLALQRLMARAVHTCPVLVITNFFDEKVGRQLLHLKVSDHFLRPVEPEELARAVMAAARSVEIAGGERRSRILTFMPVAGGVGCTTLAIEAAGLALDRRKGGTACIVDLHIKNGAVAEYLDLQPGLVLDEIEPHPERLDSQMLGVMTARHAKGVAVIAAPRALIQNRHASDRAVLAILDQAASAYDTVVIDHPATWQSWSDAIMLGSDEVYLVTEMTVPGLRATDALVRALVSRFGDRVRPKVLVNRFKTSFFSSGTRKSDAAKLLGDRIAGFIPNDYALVQEAIDRGLTLREVQPGNKISKELRTAIFGSDA
ncbi:AAA family ATPase [Prosthecomicrobium sp. N25]|uniref:AAA family ATPase n=1 Tax=Prosthecomicrobium sp. N25 TaxID=3129254 RepID=UPI00307700D8